MLPCPWRLRTDGNVELRITQQLSGYDDSDDNKYDADLSGLLIMVMLQS